MEPIEPAGYPRELETDARLRDGTAVHLRPIRPDDSPRLQAFHRRLSRDSIFLRFFTYFAELSRERADYFTHLDYAIRMALVAVDRDEQEERIVAVGRYDVVEPAVGEIALIVEDRYQNHGLGALLLAHLARAGRSRGITRFVADVLPENRRILHLLDDSGFPLKKRRQVDTIRVELELTPDAKRSE